MRRFQKKKKKEERSRVVEESGEVVAAVAFRCRHHPTKLFEEVPHLGSHSVRVADKYQGAQLRTGVALISRRKHSRRIEIPSC
ncbi:hypothetical protein M0802_013560 [Mischocyttarus mexicanus]|nr:hypothetical protein M0802_013569 [Mischocyttarus mexicanus]KAI4482962.1 hypothetical protein M0802_013560 [Mischocyttarus mexicanus]